MCTASDRVTSSFFPPSCCCKPSLDCEDGELVGGRTTPDELTPAPPSCFIERLRCLVGLLVDDLDFIVACFFAVLGADFFTALVFVVFVLGVFVIFFNDSVRELIVTHLNISHEQTIFCNFFALDNILFCVFSHYVLYSRFFLPHWQPNF